MKSTWMLPVLLAGIITATLLHTHKSDGSNEEKNIGEISEGLKAIQRDIPPATPLTLRPISVPTEVVLWCRYVMAPNYCSLNPKEKPDTVLYVCNINSTDSAIQNAIGTQSVIIRNKTANYQYILTRYH